MLNYEEFTSYQCQARIAYINWIDSKNKKKRTWICYCFVDKMNIRDWQMRNWYSIYGVQLEIKSIDARNICSYYNALWPFEPVKSKHMTFGFRGQFHLILSAYCRTVFIYIIACVLNSDISFEQSLFTNRKYAINLVNKYTDAPP